MVNKSLLHQMKSLLEPKLFNFLKDIGGLAQRTGCRAYLAGGCVRDLFLTRPVIDVDVVIEGNAPNFAKEVVKRWGGKITAESQFSTVKLRIFTTTVDFASARKETYEHPGELPKVLMADLGEDLHRRDFSINAMAVALEGNGFGQLIDPLNGERDLIDKKIRILHHQSFKDDPTRILRAIRYEQRLGFELEPTTINLINSDLKYLGCISPDRLRNEFQKIFGEEDPGSILSRATELGILNVIHPGWSWPQVSYQKVKFKEEDKIKFKSLLILALLTSSLPPNGGEVLIRKFNMPSSWQIVVRNASMLEEQGPELAKTNLRPSEIYAILKDYELPVLEAFEAISEDSTIQDYIRFYIDKLRHRKPRLTGKDLVNLGVNPGPEVGTLLNILHKSVLDRAEGEPSIEENLVRDYIKRQYAHQ